MIQKRKKDRVPRIAIVDDVPQHRGDLGLRVELAGYKPVPFEDRYSRPSQLVNEVKKHHIYGVACDQRLREGNYAGFDGAEAVAALYAASVPAILVTDYTAADFSGPIRRYRRRIPLVIRTSDADPETLQRAFRLCDQEVRQKEIPLTRRPRRAIVLIDGTRKGPNAEEEVIAFIPQWNSEEAVLFPATLVPAQLHSSLEKGRMLLASVNIDAETGDDLFFEDFELPPR